MHKIIGTGLTYIYKSAKDETGVGGDEKWYRYADMTTSLHLCSCCGGVRYKGILRMRADSSEWICSKRGIRTD